MSDDILKRPVTGPLSQTQPMRRHTMAYSYVNEEEARRRHGGSASAKLADSIPPIPEPLAPTELMPAVPVAPVIITPPRPTTVKDLVAGIAEKSIDAWIALPESVRDLMLTVPEEFTLVASKVYPNDIGTFTYRGVEFKWNGADQWMLAGMKR